MANATGVTQGSQITLFYSETAPSATTEAGLEAFIGVAANSVPCVTDLGAQEGAFNVIEYTCYGAAATSKIAGTYAAGDFVFDVAYDDSIASHMNLRDNITGTDGPAISHFVVRYQTSTTDATYVYLRGLVTSVSLAPAIDGVTTMTVTVSIEDRPIFVANAAA